MSKENNKKKVTFYIVFTLLGVIITLIFVTSTSYTQLAVASLLYPPLIYFAFKFFPKEVREEEGERFVVKVKAEGGRHKEPVEIVDVDKRAFLKMVGAAGFSFFIFSLFTRRVEDLLSRNSPNLSSLKEMSGDEVSATSEPTQGYRIAEISNEDFSYYGFVNKEGQWYVMREDPATGSYRYAQGKADFTENWTKRDKLRYDYFFRAFN